MPGRYTLSHNLATIVRSRKVSGKRERGNWTDEEEHAMLDMSDLGWSTAGIAAVLHRTYGGVSGRIYLARIKHNRKKP